MCVRGTTQKEKLALTSSLDDKIFDWTKLKGSVDFKVAKMTKFILDSLENDRVDVPFEDFILVGQGLMGLTRFSWTTF